MSAKDIVTIAGAVVGLAIGIATGNPAIGFAIGTAIGGLIGNLLFPTTIELPQRGDLQVQNATYGSPRAEIYGCPRLSSTLLWLEGNKLRSVITKQKQGKGGPTVESEEFFATLAFGICNGPIGAVLKVWADSQLIYDVTDTNLNGNPLRNELIGSRFDILLGGDGNTLNPREVAEKGVGNVSAYMDWARIDIDDFPLADYGNRLPNFSILACGTGDPAPQFDNITIIQTSFIGSTSDPLIAYNRVNEKMWFHRDLDGDFDANEDDHFIINLNDQSTLLGPVKGNGAVIVPDTNGTVENMISTGDGRLVGAGFFSADEIFILDEDDFETRYNATVTSFHGASFNLIEDGIDYDNAGSGQRLHMVFATSTAAVTDTNRIETWTVTDGGATDSLAVLRSFDLVDGGLGTPDANDIRYIAYDPENGNLWLGGEYNPDESHATDNGAAIYKCVPAGSTFTVTRFDITRASLGMDAASGVSRLAVTRLMKHPTLNQLVLQIDHLDVGVTQIVDSMIVLWDLTTDTKIGQTPKTSIWFPFMSRAAWHSRSLDFTDQSASLSGKIWGGNFVAGNPPAAPTKLVSVDLNTLLVVDSIDVSNWGAFNPHGIDFKLIGNTPAAIITTTSAFNHAGHIHILNLPLETGTPLETFVANDSGFTVDDGIGSHPFFHKETRRLYIGEGDGNGGTLQMNVMSVPVDATPDLTITPAVDDFELLPNTDEHTPVLTLGNYAFLNKPGTPMFYQSFHNIYAISKRNQQVLATVARVQDNVSEVTSRAGFLRARNHGAAFGLLPSGEPKSWVVSLESDTAATNFKLHLLKTNNTNLLATHSSIDPATSGNAGAGFEIFAADVSPDNYVYCIGRGLAAGAPVTAPFDGVTVVIRYSIDSPGAATGALTFDRAWDTEDAFPGALIWDNATDGNYHIVFIEADSTFLLRNGDGKLAKFDPASGLIVSDFGGQSLLSEYTTSYQMQHGQHAGKLWVHGINGTLGAGSPFTDAFTLLDLVQGLIIDQIGIFQFFDPLPPNTDEVGRMTFDPFRNAFWLIRHESDNSGKLYQLLPARFQAQTETLQAVVEDICSKAGYVPAEIDASGLATGVVRGYGIRRQTTARKALDPLRTAYQFDGAEIDGKIVFKFRGNASIRTISADDIAAVVEGETDSKRISVEENDELKLPAILNFEYVEEANDYDPGVQTTRRPSEVVGSDLEVTVNTPIVFQADEARDIVQILLDTAWAERETAKTQLLPKHSDLAPMDVITLPDGDLRSIEVRLGRVIVGDVVFIEGVVQDAETYTAPLFTGGDQVVAGDRTPAVITTPAASVIIFLNSNAVRDADASQPGFYFIVARESGATWPGALLVLDATTDPPQTRVINAQTEGTWGIAQTALAAPAMAKLHEATIDVLVEGPNPPSSTTQASLFTSDVNAAAIEFPSPIAGEPPDWEIIQFRDATDQGGGVYRLGGLLRGLRGTEEFQEHTAGNRVVFLDINTVLKFNAADFGARVQWGVASLNTDVSLISADEDNLVTNRFIRPYPVARMRGLRTEANNDVDIHWVPQAIVDGAWREGTDTPTLYPDDYTLRIFDGASVVRTVANHASRSFNYTAAQQTTDGLTPGDPVDIEITHNFDWIPLDGSSAVAQNFPGIPRQEIV